MPSYPVFMLIELFSLVIVFVLSFSLAQAPWTSRGLLWFRTREAQSYFLSRLRMVEGHIYAGERSGRFLSHVQRRIE